jgi:hypothetical protein
MSRRFDRNNFSANPQRGVGLNMAPMLNRGVLPKKYYGVNYEAGGSSSWSKVAHRVEQMKQMDNFMNNGVSDVIEFMARDNNGIVTVPFEHNGKLMRPGPDGWVRIADKGKLDELAEIKKFQRDLIDELMEYAMDGDEECCYMFGVPWDQWIGYCQPRGCPAGCNMDDTLKILNCTWEYIDSLPPSLTQNQSVAKRRKLVGHFAKNVNLEHLTTIADEMKNMKDGHNNPNKLSDDGLFANEKAQMKEYVSGKKAFVGQPDQPVTVVTPAAQQAAQPTG